MKLQRYWLKIDPFMMVNNVFIQLKFPLSFGIVIISLLPHNIHNFFFIFIHSSLSSFVYAYSCTYSGMIFDKKMAVIPAVHCFRFFFTHVELY